VPVDVVSHLELDRLVMLGVDMRFRWNLGQADVLQEG